MPRGGGKSSRPARRAAPARPAPQPVPVESGRRGSMIAAIGSTIAQGCALATGSALAHRAMDAVLGPQTIKYETVDTGSAAAAPAPTTNSLGGDACNVHSKAFQNCLNSYGNDISKCQFYMDMCQKVDTHKLG